MTQGALKVVKTISPTQPPKGTSKICKHWFH